MGVAIAGLSEAANATLAVLRDSSAVAEGKGLGLDDLAARITDNFRPEVMVAVKELTEAGLVDVFVSSNYPWRYRCYLVEQTGGRPRRHFVVGKSTNPSETRTVIIWRNPPQSGERVTLTAMVDDLFYQVERASIVQGRLMLDLSAPEGHRHLDFTIVREEL